MIASCEKADIRQSPDGLYIYEEQGARRLIELPKGEPRGWPEIEETGDTLEQNARLKAVALCEATGLPALADDTGLEVAALGGAPGVRSARFGGPGLDDRGRVRHLLRQIEHVADAERGARFVCVIALVGPDGRETLVVGECAGRLTREPRGTEGFGYDPIFYYPPFGVTFGEILDERKATVSHRGRAAAAARAALIAMV